MRETPERIVIAGGGTGGHVNPGLAIASELQRRRASREILFVGTTAGLESRLVPAGGFRLATIRASGLVGKGVRATLHGLGRVPLGILDSLRILGRFRPAQVVGRGVEAGPDGLPPLGLTKRRHNRGQDRNPTWAAPCR